MPARTALVSEFSVSDLCWSGSAAQSPQSPFPSAPRVRRRRVAAVGAGGRQPLAGRLAGAEQLQRQWGMEQTARCCCCRAGLGVKEGRHDPARAACSHRRWALPWLEPPASAGAQLCCTPGSGSLVMCCVLPFLDWFFTWCSRWSSREPLSV